MRIFFKIISVIILLVLGFYIGVKYPEWTPESIEADLNSDLDSRSSEEIMAEFQYELTNSNENLQEHIDKRESQEIFYVDNLAEFLGALGNDRRIVITSPINVTKEVNDIFKLDSLIYLMSYSKLKKGTYDVGSKRHANAYLTIGELYFEIIMRNNGKYYDDDSTNNRGVNLGNTDNIWIRISNTRNLTITGTDGNEFTSDSFGEPILSFQDNEYLTLEDLSFVGRSSYTKKYDPQSVLFMHNNKSILINNCDIQVPINSGNDDYIFIENSTFRNIWSRYLFSSFSSKLISFNKTSFIDNKTDFLLQNRQSPVSMSNCAFKNNKNNGFVGHRDKETLEDKVPIFSHSNTTYLDNISSEGNSFEQEIIPLSNDEEDYYRMNMFNEAFDKDNNQVDFFYAKAKK